MRLRNTLTSLLLLVCLCTAASAHPNHETAPDFDYPGAVKRMLAVDLSKALDLVTYVGPGDKGSTDYEKEYIKELAAKGGPLKADWKLSEGERRRVSLWKLPGGHGVVSLTQLVREVENYWDKWGQLPHSGPELYYGLISWGGQKSWPELSPEDVILRYYHAINPVTGKFYTDFNSEKWSPGGISIKIVDDDEEVGKHFAGQKIKGKPVTRYIHVRIWGEKQGTLLYEERVPRS
ncbi:hypothetical protein KDL29_02240 [bacterium]|nr:hypothetical protein [bacterium]